MPNRPHFDTIEMKGGGDAVSAARAVLQTGEFDYAWNMQVEDEILKRMEAGGKGTRQHRPRRRHRVHPAQHTDPWTEVDGERSQRQDQASDLTDPAVREAISLLVDRDSIQEFIYGRGGMATANFLNNPARFRSPNMKCEFNIDKANEILDEAGWKRGARRHPREGRQEAQVRLPDLDQRAAPEDPGDHQAGVPEGGHRPRAEVGHGVGVLLVGRRQPGHLHQVLCRHADVHHDACRSPIPSAS